MFYAVQYKSGRHTTTGEPNKKTGHMSIAHTPYAFSSRQERDEWVKKGEHTREMRGNRREAVTAIELRSLNLGMSMAEYNDLIDMLKWDV